MGMRGAIVVMTAGVLVAGCPLDPFSVPGCRVEGVTCDDGNVCTDDTCDAVTGMCSFEAVPAGTDCDDGDACNGIERCDSAGACADSEPVVIDDGDACTDDTCDAATGVVTHDPIEACNITFWTPLGTDGAPSARTEHTAVWSGTEMIVWG